MPAAQSNNIFIMLDWAAMHRRQKYLQWYMRNMHRNHGTLISCILIIFINIHDINVPWFLCIFRIYHYRYFFAVCALYIFALPVETVSNFNKFSCGPWHFCHVLHSVKTTFDFAVTGSEWPLTTTKKLFRL